jgi:hypothetical protein
LNRPGADASEQSFKMDVIDLRAALSEEVALSCCQANCACQVGLVDGCSNPPRSCNISLLKNGVIQYRVHQIHIWHPNAREIGSGQVGSTQSRPAKISPGEDGPCEVCSTKVGISKVGIRPV